MPEETVEELMSTYSRSELDGIAEKLGLDPKEYPNKEAIARAIISARKRPPVKAKPKKEYPKKVGIRSVKDIQAENEEAVKKIHADVKEQIEVNEEAVKKIHADVKEQIEKNEAAVKKITAGIPPIRNAIEKKVEEIQAAAKEQAKENEAYVRKFYYG
ncbi:MAG: hypothetical protein AB1779_02620 [Candidatus Thermoplasmatota archaeon]